MGIALTLYAARQHLLAVRPRRSRGAAVPVAGRRPAGSGVPRLLRRRRAARSRAHAAPGLAPVARRDRGRAHHRRDQRRARLRRPAGVDRRRPRRRGDEPGLSAGRHDPAGPASSAPWPPGRSRLDRSWLWFGAGIAAFAVSDSIYLLQIAKDTYVGDTLLDIGWLVARAAGGHRRLAAVRAQALHRRRAAEHRRADRARARPASRCSSTTTSADQSPRRRAVRRGAGGSADPPVAHAPREPLEPGHARACRRARTRSPGSATASPCSARWSGR